MREACRNSLLNQQKRGVDCFNNLPWNSLQVPKMAKTVYLWKLTGTSNHFISKSFQTHYVQSFRKIFSGLLNYNNSILSLFFEDSLYQINTKSLIVITIITIITICALFVPICISEKYSVDKTLLVITIIAMVGIICPYVWILGKYTVDKTLTMIIIIAIMTMCALFAPKYVYQANIALTKIWW